MPHRRLLLTPREHEVLYWVTQGKTNQEIGIILDISPATVGKHVEHLFTKLHVENRTAAARVALDRRLFDGHGAARQTRSQKNEKNRKRVTKLNHQ
jgi:DNA-binding CsgD family transcriptional regulator